MHAFHGGIRNRHVASLNDGMLSDATTVTVSPY